MLENIVKIADQQIEIAKFVKEHNGEITSNSNSSVDTHDGMLLRIHTVYLIVNDLAKYFI